MLLWEAQYSQLTAWPIGHGKTTHLGHLLSFSTIRGSESRVGSKVVPCRSIMQKFGTYSKTISQQNSDRLQDSACVIFNMIRYQQIFMLTNNQAVDLLPWQVDDQPDTEVRPYALSVFPQRNMLSQPHQPTFSPSHLTSFIQKNQLYCGNSSFYLKKKQVGLNKGQMLQSKNKSPLNPQIVNSLKQRAKILSQDQLYFHSLQKQTNKISHKHNQKNCSLKYLGKDNQTTNKTKKILLGLAHLHNHPNNIYQNNYNDSIYQNSHTNNIYYNKPARQRTSFSGFVERKRQKERQQKILLKSVQQLNQLKCSKTSEKSARDDQRSFSPNQSTNYIFRGTAYSAQKGEQKSKCNRRIDSGGYRQKKKQKVRAKMVVSKKQSEYCMRDNRRSQELVVMGLLRTQQ